MKTLFILIVCSFFLYGCSMDSDTVMDSSKEMEESILDVSCKCEDQLLHGDNRWKSWDYPVKPGMKEWKGFTTHDEMLSACQIPDVYLNCMSTEKLTDLCLDYPLLMNIFAFNFLDIGLDQLFSEFNGIRELFERCEVSNSLIKRYKDEIEKFSSCFDKAISEQEVASRQISITKFDALFSRVEKQNGDIVGLKKILKTLVEGYEDISKLDFDTRYLLSFNYFSRAHLIIKINEKYIEEIPQGSNNAVFSPHGADVKTSDIINKLSYQLVQ